jgi:hypothetical protein
LIDAERGLVDRKIFTDEAIYKAELQRAGPGASRFTAAARTTLPMGCVPAKAPNATWDLRQHVERYVDIQFFFPQNRGALGSDF